MRQGKEETKTNVESDVVELKAKSESPFLRIELNLDNNMSRTEAGSRSDGKVWLETSVADERLAASSDAELTGR